MKKFLALRSAGLLSLLFLLGACSSSQDNSLLSDQKADPLTHVLDKTPKVDELYIKTYVGSVAVPNGVKKVEISGECYTSTYSSHKIIATDKGYTIDIMDINPTTDVTSQSATCKNGRFNLAINAELLTSGSHSIRFVMQAYDSNGQIVTNDVQGVSTLTLTK